MNEVRASRLPAATRVILLAAGGVLTTFLLILSLPFWLGPLTLTVTALMGELMGCVAFAAGLCTVSASMGAVAFIYLFWRLDHDGLANALDLTWDWGAIVRRGWWVLVIFLLNLLVLDHSPTLEALVGLLTSAGGVPAGLVTFCAYSVMVLWYAPAVLLGIFALCSFASQMGGGD